MFTTVGTARTNLSILGLDIPFIKAGEELPVLRLNDEQWRITSGRMAGVIVHNDHLNFDMPEQDREIPFEQPSLGGYLFKKARGW